MDDLTDREALEALLSRFGLTPYSGQPMDDVPNPDARPDVELSEPNEVVLTAQEGGVEGYSGFIARFTFDDEGNFKSLGIWE
jgi:hypothetical protein